MYDDLRGKKALVTGSGKGIGRGIALALAAEGVDVAINVRNDVAAGEKTAEEARGHGVRVVLHQADVSHQDQVNTMVDRVVDELGGIDILVNNAGGAGAKGISIEEYDTDAFRTMIDECFYSTLYCCQAVGKHLVRQLSGSVINITSLAAVRALPFWGAYSVSKQAVTMLTRQLAGEWLEPEGSTIRVNAIAPGLIATPRTERFVTNPVAMGPRLAGIPMGRVGTPEDIANFVVFLASDRSSFMTGQELVVDGGETDYWAEMARFGRT